VLEGPGAGAGGVTLALADCDGLEPTGSTGGREVRCCQVWRGVVGTQPMEASILLGPGWCGNRPDVGQPGSPASALRNRRDLEDRPGLQLSFALAAEARPIRPVCGLMICVSRLEDMVAAGCPAVVPGRSGNSTGDVCFGPRVRQDHVLARMDSRLAGVSPEVAPDGDANGEAPGLALMFLICTCRGVLPAGRCVLRALARAGKADVEGSARLGLL